MKYVKKIDGDGIHYTDEFYLEMFRLTHDEGLTYVEAYKQLGFDTKELGERRAVQAGYRATRFALEKFFYGGDDSIIDLKKGSWVKRVVMYKSLIYQNKLKSISL